MVMVMGILWIISVFGAAYAGYKYGARGKKALLDALDAAKDRMGRA